VTIAAILFAACTAFTIAFQLALAAGAPWGELAMGGRHPGRLPPTLRVAAAFQSVVLALVAGIVLSRAGLVGSAWRAFSGRAIWGVVALSTLAAVLNTITPSRRERLLWAPVAAVMLVCSVIVATRG
jgi:hypothetical protein